MRYSLVSGLLLLAVSPFTSLALPVDPNDQPGQWDPSGQYRKGHYGANGEFIPNEGTAEVGYNNGQWNNGEYNNGGYNNWNNGQYNNGRYNNGRWERRWVPGVGVPGAGIPGEGERERAGLRHPGARIGVPGIRARWWPWNNGNNDENGWTDANGQWHSNNEQGWTDANGQWHANNNGQGWTDANGQWHPNVKRALPGVGVPGAGVPGAGAPAAGVPAAGAPGVGAPGVGTPGVGAPNAGVPGEGLNGAGSPTPTTNGAGAAGLPLARRYYGPNEGYYDNDRYNNGYDNGRYDNGRYNDVDDYNRDHHDVLDLPDVVFRRWWPHGDNWNSDWNRPCNPDDWSCHRGRYNHGYRWDRCENGNGRWNCRSDWNRNRATPLPSVVVARHYPSNTDYNNNYASATPGTSYKNYNNDERHDQNDRYDNDDDNNRTDDNDNDDHE